MPRLSSASASSQSSTVCLAQRIISSLVRRYNRAQEEPAARIPEQGSAGSRALCVLVGNCKLLWPAFLAACAADDSLMSAADPLDTYTESSLDALAQPRYICRLLCAPVARADRTALCRSCVRVLYAHDEHAAGSAYVGMQLLAEVAGVCWPACCCALLSCVELSSVRSQALRTTMHSATSACTRATAAGGRCELS